MIKKILLIISLIILFGCSVKTVREYYIITYYPHTDMELLERYNLNYPLPYSIQVDDFKINSVYDKINIVFRKSLHMLTYDNTQRWAMMPDEALTELYTDHLRKYNIFKNVRREYLDELPDYYIDASINNIEMYASGNFSYAYINMTLFLKDKYENIIFSHNFSDRSIVKEGNTVFFVKVVSDVCEHEFDIFVKKMLNYFEKEIKPN